jgi:CDP-diacylglycerol--serine O-phosphatidyltransferase
MRQHIPNTLTLGNLLCGVLACKHGVMGDYSTAALLVACSAFLDVLDGAAARVLRVSSSIGKDLDSLADVVSFGVAPSLAAFNLLSNTLNSGFTPLAYTVLLLPLATAYRLARFNQSDSKHPWFIGLPSPANGIFWISIVFLADSTTLGSFFLFLLCAAALLFSWLMISNIRMYALKGLRSVPRAKPFLTLLALFSLIALGFVPWQGVPAVSIGSYIVLSILFPPRSLAHAG